MDLQQCEENATFLTTCDAYWDMSWDSIFTEMKSELVSAYNNMVYEYDEGPEGEGEDTANAINRAINVGDIVTDQGTGSSVVSAYSTNVSQSCMCVGCSDFKISNQSLELPQSKVAVSYSSKQGHSSKTKQYCRTIQPSWYKKYSWITVCTKRHKIFVGYVVWPNNKSFYHLQYYSTVFTVYS